jgi:hypothetical protein
VTLSSDIGSIEPMDVTLSDQGIGNATMRSVSIGTATVRALSPPLTPANAQIKFSWPLAFFVASIVGGVAGALLSRIQRSGLPKKKSTATVLIRVVLSGIIVVALYAIGVNVLPIHPTANAGEVLAFAIAAAGGFVGLKIQSGS